MTTVHLALRSRNVKTGPIPVTTSESSTCPTACPFNHMNTGGCYAAGGPLGMFWKKVSDGRAGDTWGKLLDQVSQFAMGQLWRHNQAGDLPGIADEINRDELNQLVVANHGKKGFTYSHKPIIGHPENALAIRAANDAGFTINLSANTLEHADMLADTGAGPVVVVLPSTVSGKADIKTPAGRRVVVCPATYKDSVNCQSCGLCAVASRSTIVGFPAHGVSARTKVDSIVKGE